MFKSLDKALETFTKYYAKFWNSLVKLVFNH